MYFPIRVMDIRALPHCSHIRILFSMHPRVVYMLYVFPYENFAAIILPFYQKIIMLTAVGGLEEEGFFTISG